MTYQTKPTADGAYRIKVLTQNLFVQDDTESRRPGLKLAAPSSSNKQVWNLARVSGQTDVWTITSAYDKSGLTYAKTEDTYWGYGYPYPQSGSSQNWAITEQSSEGQTYSNDVVFLQDLTGSQQPYLDAARKEVDQIWKSLLDTGSFAPGDLRFGAIGFRDHPPQDDTFPSKVLIDFTPNIDSVATELDSFLSKGGGDGPEAQADAMADALENVTWNTNATKVAILITDSPPHGTKEPGDAWPDKCPCQKDPLRLATRMFKMGITLASHTMHIDHDYQGARQFYEGLVEKTHGKVYNLGDDPNLLNQVIIGSALQEVDSNALVAQHRAAVRSESKASNFNAAAFAQKLHSNLSAANVQHHTLDIDNMVEPNPAGDKIVRIWSESESLEEAHAKIQQVMPSRIKEQYLDGALPTASIGKKPITLAQVETVVQKCLHRES
ncbi:hypothetical protein FRC10_004747 [Ceratobasidium sp. 414]|nr:hypothetical protein FRC10_004747 [Ceratobasidium sp. 414]